MDEQVTDQVDQTEADNLDIGEDYAPTPDNEDNSESEENLTDKTDENQESEDEGPEIKASSLNDEQKRTLIDQAQEFYGVKQDQVVVDKKGNIKLIVKINGKERLINPKTDMLKGFNLSQAGYEKLNEGKQLIKQVKEFFNEAKSNPQKMWEIADNLGIDKYELAKQLLQEKIDDHEMTDEQRELKQLKKKQEEWQKKEEEEKKRIEQEQLTQARQKEVQRYDQELTQAMTKHGFKKSSGATKSHVLLSAIGELIVAQKSGYNLSCDDAVYRAKEKWQSYVQDFYSDIEDDQILNIVPKNIIERLRKADLNKLNLGIPTSNSNDIGQQVDLEDFQEERPQQGRRKEKVSINDFFNDLKGLK